MKEMAGGAVEAFCRHGGTSRESGWGQRFKPLFLKRVLPLKSRGWLNSMIQRYQYYQHIMLWDRERDEIIGGYRLGRADAILTERGFSGLYTSTLFEYSEYLGVSRKLMVEFLKEGHTHSDLARFVRARNCPPFGAMRKKHLGLAYSMVHEIQDFSELISDIEQNGTGIPILLKHYMKLGGKFLSFSVDPKFNNALDALVLVDLARTDPRILGRYMGQQGAVSFLHFNGAGPEGAADCDLP